MINGNLTCDLIPYTGSYAFLIYLYIFDTSVPPLYVFLPKIMPRSQINTDYDDEEVRYYIESRYGTDIHSISMVHQAEYF